MPVRIESSPSSKTGQQRAVADALRGQLIDGGTAGIEIVARGALDVAAGEPGGDFGPVAVAADGLGVPEILQEQEVALQVSRAASGAGVIS